MATDPLLSLEDVHTYYGDHHVLQGVSFEVGRDEVVAYMGRNGTGKTTTFKAIMGLVEPTRGTITYDGERLNGLPSHVIGRRGIRFVSAENKVFPHLTVKENIRLSTLEADREPDFEYLFDLFPDLAEYPMARAGVLSGGQQQMVAVAQGLAADPDLLLLDEPVQGLAHEFVEKVGSLVERLSAEEDIAVLLVEHDLEFAIELADGALVLDEGSIVFDGAAAELRENSDVVDKYIGVQGFAEVD